MNGHVAQHEEHSAEDAQSNHILPHCQYLEAEAGKNGGAGHFNVETVLLIHQGKVAHFIDDEAFEAEVEDGELR